MNKKIKIGTLNRGFTFDKESVNTESRTVDLAFSSEEPYERYFGIEILDHNVKSIRLGRVSNGAPLLLDHDPAKQIGIIEEVSIDNDKVGRAKVRFSKSQFGEEIYQDVIDGIRTKISVGYLVHAMKYEGKQSDLEVYRVNDWEPFEISIVSIPADDTVGVGRNTEFLEKEIDVEIEDIVLENEEVKNIEEKQEDNTELFDNKNEINENITNSIKTIENNYKKENKEMDIQKNINEILNLGDKFAKNGGKELANEFIRNGKYDVEMFKEALFDKLETQGVIKTADTRANEGGLSGSDVKQYSVLNAIGAIINGQNCRELEISNQVAKQLGRSARGFFIPAEVLKRDLNVGTAGDGGYTVATELHAQDFIEMLKNKMVINQLGARTLSGLVGTVAIPKQTGGASHFWVAENGTITESSATFDQVALTPKTVGALTDVSRYLLKQSSLDVENFLMQDLAGSLALAIDSAAISGTGADNQPRGILNTSGIGAVAMGTNGAAIDWASIVDLETSVATSNADVGSLAYLTNAKVRGSMKKVEKVASTGNFIYDGEMLNGYGLGVSNQVPANLTKGTGTALSAMIFGNFNDLVIGQWGVLDILVDPYTGSNKGSVRVVAMQDVDVAVRNAASFAAIKDIVA